MTESQLDEIESRLGIELPAEYRAVMLDYPFPPDSWPAQAEMPNSASFLIAMNERLAKEPPPGWKPGHFAFGHDGDRALAFELGLTDPPVLALKHDRDVFDVDAESLDEWVRRRVQWYVACDEDLTGRKYESFVSKIEAAGFFTSGIEPMSGWDRVTVASKREGPQQALSGVSFWVSTIGDAWFLGTWGRRLYRLEPLKNVAACCVEWLSRGRGTGDFDEQLKREFGLVRTSEEEFDAIIEVIRKTAETDD